MIGPVYAKRLKKLGIESLRDLIYHFPFRYDDFSLISEISRVQPGEVLTIKGRVLSIKNEYTKAGKRIQKAVVSDGTGKIEIVWFNQPFLVKTIKAGEWYAFAGKIDWFGKKIVMVFPEHESLKERTIHTSRLVPIYPETYGISSKWLRSRIASLLNENLLDIKDFLPEGIKDKDKMISLKEALSWIHFPDNKEQIAAARKRLAFDEFFLIQLAALKRKEEWQKRPLSYKLLLHREKIIEFVKKLPFSLTNAQKRVLREILSDLTKDKPMNRLLEGDVGSGKTIVAAVAIYAVYLNGFQSILMAPTEILASQHFQTLKQFLSPFGLKIVLLTGNLKPPKDNQEKIDVYVGTHALIQRKVEFARAALVVIDEQHRFGVEQRAALIKKNTNPHVLTMTATPIPRTIALTLYGDLDLSFLDEMPPGRQRVKTWVVPKIKRGAAYRWIRERIKGEKEQCFIVCPLIEESETLKSIKAVTTEFDRLSKEIFPDLRLGLLHGKLKSKEKEEIINQFRRGELDILVSTPVIEVGVDIPQATIMMIEDADRFGLAQLHQLRGRVGRGEKQSFCLLFTELNGGKAIERLRAMEKMCVGAELAELDLKIRGPGEIYGTAQHGFPRLKIASFTDLELIQKTRQAANGLIGSLSKFPLLRQELESYTIKQIVPD